MSEPEIAIDFGTSRTKVACFNAKEGKSELIELGRDNPRFVPSIFYVGTEDEGGIILVGDDAQQRLADDPLGIVLGLKLDIDSPGKITVGAGRPRLRRTDLLKELFGSIRETCVGQHFHAEVSKCTITVPVVFEEPKREAIRKAAEMAGFTEIRLLEEPVAAALAWLAEKPDHVPNHVVICDVGGGTTDFALVRHTGDRFEPAEEVAPFGFSLGGNNLDENIWIELSSGGNGNVDATRKNIYLQEIRKAKERLDSIQGDTVTLGNPENVQLPVETLRRCCANFTDDVVEQLEEFLKKCQTSGGIDLAAVLLVGGSSKLPGLRARVEKLGSQVFQWLKSEWAPVLGAALPRDFRPNQGGAGVVGQTTDEIKYREAVRVAWLDRVIEESELKNLTFYAKELGISQETATQIEREVTGQTKEEAHRAAITESYASILDDTRELIQAGKGREAFDNAEKALIATGADLALDAWLNAMDTVSSRERILGSSEGIAAATDRPDIAVCARVIAHMTADAKEINMAKILAWLEPLGEDVRTYPHAISLLLYWGETGEEKSLQAKAVLKFARIVAPDSEYLDFLEIGQNTETKEGMVEIVRGIRKHPRNPVAVMLEYLCDFETRHAGASETSDLSELTISDERREEIVRQLRHIAADSFPQRLVAAFHALHEGRPSEFLNASKRLVTSSFCSPTYGAILWRWSTQVYLDQDPPNFAEAVACLENVVDLDKDADGDCAARLSELLMEWAQTVFDNDTVKSRQLANRSIGVCDEAFRQGKNGEALRNQRTGSMVHGIGIWRGLQREKQLIQDAYTQSLTNLEVSPSDAITQAMHFSCCALKIAPDLITCICPFIPPNVLSCAVKKYLGQLLLDDEPVLFLYDAAVFNTGQVGVAVTPQQIIANTRFSGLTKIDDWVSKTTTWADMKLTVGGSEVPYGYQFGDNLGEILKQYQHDVALAKNSSYPR
jgi:molecular chaperone DnaK